MNRMSGLFKLFSLVFGVVYLVCFYYNWALFRYYPVQRQFHYASQPASAGPAILWYGWLAAAAVVSAAAGLLVPRKIADRIWDELVWIVPVGLVAGILIYEKRWFV